MNRKIREIKRKVRKALGLRNTLGDRIIIRDEILVYQGDKLLFKSKGHIVNQGLIGIVNWLGGGSGSTYCPAYQWSAETLGIVHVGTGTGATTGTTVALVNDEGTDPDAQSGALASPATGTYRISYIATWNAGTLGAIDVSEFGMWLYVDPTLNAFEDALSLGLNFFSRLSDSDGDFTTFTVNTLVPLTIEWRLTLTFA